MKSARQYYGPEPYLVLAQGEPHPDHKFTARAAAAYLNVSDAWLSTLRTSGRGPRFIQVGARYWYSAEDLNRWSERESRELPVVRVVGPALPREEIKQLPWYSPAPEESWTMGRERVYRVALPPALATEKNEGYGYLVLPNEPGFGWP